ncbi:MAG TPA: DUF308 domain-containing protein [Candidatus Angelobacter sp.]|nr:DUF308 domain-containing protein [Candidatus Angelobacter sp.]
MLRILVHNWWLLALRGVFALLFAVFIFSVQPLASGWLLQAMVRTSVVESFGLLALGAGIFTIIAAIRGLPLESDWWLLLLNGIGACAAGVLAICIPGLTFILLVRVITVWTLFAGACELLMAYKLRRHVPDEWFMVLAAVGSMAFGVYIFVVRLQQEHQLFLWLGSYALYSAIAMLGLALRLRKLRGQAHLAAQHATANQS